MKTITHHPLKVWLFENNETQAEFAQRAGVAQSMVSSIVRGKSNLTMAIIRRISAATGGKLKANDFQGAE